MNTMISDPRSVIFDPQSVDWVALDSRTHNQTAEPVSTNHSRWPLLCRWQREAQGRLACSWREIGPDEAGDPNWEDSRRTASPGMKSAIEASPPALRSGRRFATPSQTLSRAQAVTHWIAIALLLAGAGLELVLCFTVESSGIL
jgi:hypothetical protein